MATLSKNILGNISGSIADLTFRRAHGKTFIVNKPSSYSTPVDPDSVRRRNDFGFYMQACIGDQFLEHSPWILAESRAKAFYRVSHHRQIHL